MSLTMDPPVGAAGRRLKNGGGSKDDGAKLSCSSAWQLVSVVLVPMSTLSQSCNRNLLDKPLWSFVFLSPPVRPRASVGAYTGVALR